MDSVPIAVQRTTIPHTHTHTHTHTHFLLEVETSNRKADRNVSYAMQYCESL